MALTLHGLEIATWTEIEAWVVVHAPDLFGGSKRGKMAKVNQVRRQVGQPEYTLPPKPPVMAHAIRDGSPWPGRDDELRERWADETKSTAEIAKDMGLSKNAVNGHAGRIGLSRKSPILPPVERGPVLPKVESREAAAREIMRGISACSVESGALVALPAPLALPPVAQPAGASGRKKSCAFPMWPDGCSAGWPQRFCDEPTKAGSVYCTDHHRTCYTAHREWSDEAREAARLRLAIGKAQAAMARP